MRTRRKEGPVRRNFSEGGFTLTEVVIALAVVSIGIVAVLGLLPTALQSSRNAADNTLAATIVQDTFSDMRRQVLASTVWPTAATTLTTYWDATGLLKNPLLASDNYFLVTLTWTPSPSMPLSVLVITATVTWPAKPGMITFLNTSTFVTEIARYNQ